MAIKTKQTTPDISALIAQAVAQALGQAQSAPQAAAKPGAWGFKILAQEGTAAIVLATPPKGDSFRALATVSDSGRVKLGFKLDGTTLAKGFHKLLGAL